MFCARMTKRYPTAKKFREGRSNLGRRHKSRCGRRRLHLLAARRCGSQHPALLVVNPTPNTAWSRHMEHHARWRQCRKTSPSSRMATDSTPTTWTSLDGCLQESIAILSGHQTLEDASTAENEIAGLRIGNLQSDRRSKHPQPADEIPENQRATTAPHPPAFQRYLQPSNETLGTTSSQTNESLYIIIQSCSPTMPSLPPLAPRRCLVPLLASPVAAVAAALVLAWLGNSSQCTGP